MFYEPLSSFSGFTLRQEAVAFGHKTELGITVSALYMLFSHYFDSTPLLQNVVSTNKTYGSFLVWGINKEQEYLGSVLVMKLNGINPTRFRFLLPI